MPWDQDPVLAVMGAIVLFLIFAAPLSLICLTVYYSWYLAPLHPVAYCIVGGLVVAVFALVWLARSRCPQCKRFFVAKRTGTEVDHVPTPVTVSGGARQMQVTAERVVIIRHYRCRRCGAKFSRRS